MRLKTLYITILSFCVVSCNIVADPEIDIKRIKSIEQYVDEEIVSRRLFEYNADLLIKSTCILFSESNEEIIHCISEFDYEGNTETTFLLYSNENELIPTYKIENYYDEELLIERIEFRHVNGQYQSTFKSIYTYNNSLLNNFEFYSFPTDEYILRHKFEYSYSENLINEILSHSFLTGSIIPGMKYTFTNNGYVITGYIKYYWVSQDESWKEQRKFEYFYNSLKVTMIDEYIRNEANTDWVFDRSSQFLYDSDGYLLEIRENVSNSLNDVLILINYECGIFDKNVLKDSPDQLIYGKPDYPSPIIYN